MKRFFAVLMLVLLATVLFAMPVLAQGETPPDPVLTTVQLFVIGAVASALVWGIKALKKRGTTIASGWLTIGVYVISFGLAFAFAPLALPPFPPFADAVTFVQALLNYISALLIPISALAGAATLVYNVLLKRILDGIGERVTTRYLSRG